MTKLVVIGSSCVDITILMDHLPNLEEDVNAKAQKMSLGGCAHNAAHAAGLFHVPFVLASPVGTGIYGEYVEQALAREGIPVWQRSEEENGACYCLVDEDGNRSFMCIQGAEYHFRKEWLASLDVDADTWIYVCGLEIEQTSGEAVISYLENTPAKVCFATGPRITKLPCDKMERMLKRAQMIHLNAREAMSYTHCDNALEAAKRLYAYHGAAIIITDGGHDVTVYTGTEHRIPAVPCEVVDGTGAGDSHIGSILACLCRGESLLEAVGHANAISSTVCRHVGACIQEEDIDWEQIK